MQKEIMMKNAKREAELAREKRQRATIALSVASVPFIALGIWFGKTFYLATHKTAGEVSAFFGTDRHVMRADNKGNVTRIYIVGLISVENWNESRQLRGLGYEVRVLTRRQVNEHQENPVTYRVDSSVGSDVFTNYGAMCDHLKALSMINEGE